MKIKKNIVLPIISLGFCLCLWGCATITQQTRAITQQTRVWRINDKEGSEVFFARDLKIHLNSAGVVGTITITPTQGYSGEMAHVDSADSWSFQYQEGSGQEGSPSYYFDGPYLGTEVTSDVVVTGTAYITAGGLIYGSKNGKGYDFVILRDIQSGKQVKITKFSAVEVMAGDIPSILSK